jgi:hypothetical protein
VLGGFLFGFGFRRQFSQVLHHGVGIDLTDGTYFTQLAFKFQLPFAFALQLTFAFKLSLTFELPFTLELALTQEAANDVANGAQPALTFHAGLAFQFAFEFVFGLIQGHVCSSLEARSYVRSCCVRPFC